MHGIIHFAAPIFDSNNLLLILTLLGVTILGGCLGGLVNYYLAQSEKKAGEESRRRLEEFQRRLEELRQRSKTIVEGTASTTAEQTVVQISDETPPAVTPEHLLTLWQSMIIGVAAALLVPLLLSLIQSDLLDTVGTNVGKLFVYTGFCVAAGVSSRTFVRGMADYLAKQALRASQDANEKSNAAMNQVIVQEKALQKKDEISIDASTTEGLAIDQHIDKRIEELNNKIKSFASEWEDKLLTILPSDTVSKLVESEEEPLKLPSKEISSEKSPLELQEELVRLEEKYSDIRNQPSGHLRTYEMTRIIRNMIDLLIDEAIQIDELRHLNSPDRAKRLAGIANLCANPDMNFLPELVKVISAVNHEDEYGVIWEVEPFAQYWGIEAISRILKDKHAQDIKPDTLTALNELQKKLGKSTDRYAKLSAILREL